MTFRDLLLGTLLRTTIAGAPRPKRLPPPQTAVIRGTWLALGTTCYVLDPNVKAVIIAPSETTTRSLNAQAERLTTFPIPRPLRSDPSPETTLASLGNDWLIAPVHLAALSLEHLPPGLTLRRLHADDEPISALQAEPGIWNLYMAAGCITLGIEAPYPTEQCRTFLIIGAAECANAWGALAREAAPLTALDISRAGAVAAADLQNYNLNILHNAVTSAWANQIASDENSIFHIGVTLHPVSAAIITAESRPHADPFVTAQSPILRAFPHAVFTIDLLSGYFACRLVGIHGVSPGLRDHCQALTDDLSVAFHTSHD